MKKSAIALIGIPFLAGCAGSGSPDGRAILSEWKYVSVRHRGQPFDPGRDARISITTDAWTIRRNGVTLESTYTLDEATDPKRIDMDVKWPDGRVLRLRSIYRIEGNRLTLCEPESPDLPRPARFAAEADDAAWLVILEKAE